MTANRMAAVDDDDGGTHRTYKFSTISRNRISNTITARSRKTTLVATAIATTLKENQAVEKSSPSSSMSMDDKTMATLNSCISHRLRNSRYRNILTEKFVDSNNENNNSNQCRHQTIEKPPDYKHHRRHFDHHNSNHQQKQQLEQQTETTDSTTPPSPQLTPTPTSTLIPNPPPPSSPLASLRNSYCNHQDKPNNVDEQEQEQKQDQKNDIQQLVEQQYQRTTRLTTKPTTTLSVLKSYSWLFGLFCMMAILGGGEAGFACLSNPCVFGVCIDGLNSSYSCYCIDGYTGIQCQTNWDECWSGPCQNGGTCVDGVAYYNCTCQDGFSGANCQENVDECMSNPCQNGGICRDRDNGYVCTCQPGYLGLHCEIDVAVCETGTGARCHNGGECIEGKGLEFTCDCPPGWTGRICQDEINECESAPCQNGGVCVDKLASYVCACPMGYTGTNCEEEILICADSPCQNNALCLMEEGIPTCYCVPDYHGEKCEFQYDECQLGPKCMNGGVCIDGVDTFSCSCPPMLTGMLCECLMMGEDSLDCNYTAPSTSSTTTTTTEEPSSEEGTTPAQPVFTTTGGVSGSSSIASSESGETGESLTSEGSSSAETAESDESLYTTISRFDVSEVTTSKSPKVSSSEESEETAITITAHPTIIHHRTTIKTTAAFPYDYTTHRPPTPIWPTTPVYVTEMPESRPTSPRYYPSEATTFSTTLQTEYTDYDQENNGYATTHRPSPPTIGITTTVAPFFTEYPEVIVTTKVTEFTKEYGTRFTTFKPPTSPFFPSSTLSPYDYESPGGVSIDITTSTPGGGKSPTITPYWPAGSTSQSILPAFSPTPPPFTDHTTKTLYTDDLVTTYPTTLPPPTTTTEYIPPPTTAAPTLPPPPPPPTTTTPAPTEPPPPPPPPTLPVLTTEPSIPSSSISSSSSSSSSSSEESSESGGSSGGSSGGASGGVDNVTTGIPDCIKLGCYNGGTCVTTSEGSRCVCRFDRQGPLCESPIVIKNAAFSGDSYVSHRIHKDIPQHDSLDSVLPMHVQLKVRTRATNGLIMLAAAQGTKGGHYMALFLQKGLLQFQFSCGLQTMLLSELETPVNTGNEITIRAELDFSRNYTHCNASLLVNDTLAMSGDQPTWLKLLPPRMHTPEVILNTWLHLGGAPQAPIGLIIELPPAQSGTGFTGCLHSLRINGATREIFGDALDGFGITECGSLACLSSPCRNGAACIKIESNEIDENGEKAEKWKCKCPTGYMGPTCEISVCEDNPCQYGGTCVQFPGSGYLCLCPLGKHGHYCEHNLEVALPSFSGSVNGLSSFVAYTVPIPLEYSVELSFKILPQTMSQISLLAFLGQSGYHDEKSDHLAVSFIQGYIMLTWNLGGGPRRIFTQKPIDFRLDAPRVPYEIKVGRIGRQAWLSVDGKFNITGRSPGSVTRMDVVPILYLGGHEIANFNTLPHDLPLHSGFQGCIYDVNLKAGQVTVPLQETRGVRGRGVGQCGTRECHRHACQHDGACLQHGATFTCICQEGWYGPLCAQASNPCDSFNNKCDEESTCVPLVNGYECDCPVGMTGKNCDEDIHSLSDVSLTGRRSYLAVRWPYLGGQSDKLGSKRSQIISYRNFTKKIMPPKPISSPSQHFVMKLLNEVEKQRSFSPVPLMGSKSFEEHHRVQFFFIEFQLRPLSERGLLLYFGTLNNNQDKKIGFVSLSLQGGVVEFRISGPSNHVTVVRSVRMLAIGEWHKIKMAQRGRWLTLWVEGSASSALAPSAEVLVEPDSLLYLGGLKDLSKLPHNAISGFPIPFRGCVRGLVVSGTRIVLNETNILESRNIRDCDGTACGGDSCEAGGHCWLDEKLQPHCICPEYAKGERCEYSETCKLIPCKNNGRCLRSGRCSCPNGWGGFYCEIAMSKPTTPSFRGNSYLILPPPRIPMKDKRKGPSMYLRPREAFQISLNFSTIVPDGLLLWSERDRGAKFLGLGLEDGHMKIASNLLGSSNDTIEAPSGGFMADGGWHIAKIILDRNRFELDVDGEVIFSEKLSSTQPMTFRRGKEPSITYEDSFYLGGFPNMESVSERTKERFDQPFKGCLQDIQFGPEPNSIITDFSSYQGENIGSCDLHGDDPVV